MPRPAATAPPTSVAPRRRPVLLRALLLAAVLWLVIWPSFRSVILDWNDLPSNSMQPTLLKGDRLLVHKSAYDLRLPFTLRRLARWAEPRRGDLVVFFSPEDNKRLLKRIVGIPGDTLAMREGFLEINGQALEYQEIDAAELPWLDEGEREQFRFWREQLGEHDHAMMLPPWSGSRGHFDSRTVPEGRYFVMGDNRTNSRDSRYFGFVDRRAIVGKVTRVVWSVAPDGTARPGRFFLPVS